MNDNTAMFLICVCIILILLYRYSKRNVKYTTDLPLGPGTYRVGEDLDPGKCDIVAVSGVADVCIKERGNDNWNNPFKLSPDSPVAPDRYRNMTLHAHDILEINGKATVMLMPPSAILDIHGAELTLGTYQFGVDLPPAKYDLKALGGNGQFTFFAPKASEFSVFQDMAFDVDGKTDSYTNLLCEPGSSLVVDGTLKLKLTKSRKQRGQFYRILDFVNQDP